jgi:hypothetical protein
MSNCQLTALPALTFANCTSLQTLLLSGNVLTAIDPAAFAGLRALQYLCVFIQPCLCLSWPAPHRLCAQLPLRLFLTLFSDLSTSVQVTSLPPTLFADLTSLTTLFVLCHFVLLFTIQEISLSHFLTHVVSLFRRYMTEVAVTTLPADLFRTNTQLTVLSLEGASRVTSLPSLLLATLTRLQNL